MFLPPPEYTVSTTGGAGMKETRVWVRRERPTALAWSIALAVTMLAVYTLTWTAARPRAAQVSAAPRVTREVALEELEGWCVTLGAFEDAARARVEAAGCAGRGAAGCVVEAEGAWHVLGAMYDSEREARRMADRLREKDGLQAEVLPLRAEALRLRVTAPEPQIEQIEAADALLAEQTVRLADMALQLDRGQLQPDAARTLCALTATEAQAAAEKLSLFPGAADDPLCAGLTRRLTALAAQLNAVAQTRQTAPAALSGMIRLAGIDDFIGLAELRKG